MFVEFLAKVKGNGSEKLHRFQLTCVVTAR